MGVGMISIESGVGVAGRFGRKLVAGGFRGLVLWETGADLAFFFLFFFLDLERLGGGGV